MGIYCPSPSWSLTQPEQLVKTTEVDVIFTVVVVATVVTAELVELTVVTPVEVTWLVEIDVETCPARVEVLVEVTTTGGEPPLCPTRYETAPTTTATTNTAPTRAGVPTPFLRIFTKWARPKGVY